MPNLLELERAFWSRGVSRLGGIDEAGRGPLAGPVVAACVVIPADVAEREYTGSLAGLNDSKQLTASSRDGFFDAIRRLEGVEIGIGLADSREIDRDNILRATHSAMARAVLALPALPEHLLVDGLPVPGLPVKSTAYVRGDSRSLLIAAASVVAKVTRDRRMDILDAEFPAYGFSRHKGYGTKTHLQALFELGPCPEHRRSFRPVRESEAIRARGQSGAANRGAP
jgi:ribonuclease HII